MISDGLRFIVSAPLLTIAPGLMLVLTVLSLNIFGEGVRDASTRGPASAWSTDGQVHHPPAVRDDPRDVRGVGR